MTEQSFGSRALRSFTTVAAVCVAVGLGASAYRAATAPSPAVSSQRLPSGGGLKSVKELLAIFIGSEACGASRDPTIPAAVKRVHEALRRQVAVKGGRFGSIGIALDWSPEMGVAFLSKIATFDEIMAGRNWIGTGAVRYVWKDWS